MKTKIITLALMLAVLMPAQAEKHEKYSWDKDLKHRLLRDFRRSHEEVKQYIQRYLPYVTTLVPTCSASTLPALL